MADHGRGGDARDDKALWIPAEVNPAGLLAYYERLTAQLEFPIAGHYRAGDEDYFVLVQRLYPPDEESDVLPGLMCDVRQENRPMLVPLAEIQAAGDDAAGALIAEYAAWLHGVPMQVPIAHGSPHS